MKSYPLLAVIIVFLLSRCQPVTNTCYKADASGIDQKEVVLANGTVRQTDKAVHDTLAVDLLIIVKDKNGEPVKDALAEIATVATQKTDAKGEAAFIAFHNDGSTFTARISHKDHGCMEITGIRFGSGDIRRLEVVFSK